MRRGGWPALLTLLAVCVAGLGGCGDAGSSDPDATSPTDASGVAGGEILGLPVDLYFPTSGGWLAAETRELPPGGQPVDKIRAVVEALLAGPRSSDGGLVRPLPEDVGILGVYLGPNGVAFVDLGTAEPREPPAMGSREEMQIVYSLVNSVTLNVAEVRRVVLLWNGDQRPTFAGHLDTSQPLAPDTDLVVR